MEKEEKTAAYRIYMTDCLSGFVGAKQRYYDIVYQDRKKSSSISAKIGDRIALETIKKLGLKFEVEGE